ncbi:MAG: voltage-gated chloride channel family protein [Bdellovibrionaceae bacterium]|nr:voltage-gated chloride channel family protein [Pseudobdellovibrionaceae bacterium]
MIKKYLRWSLLSVLSGALSGLAAAVFLISLEWATDTRNGYPVLIWALPVAGLFIGWLFHRFGKDVEGGSNLIIDEIHDPKKTIPLRMAPFVLIGTLLTHLFGGSAGREGTAVQMGASLSDQLSRFFKIEPEERKILLVSGAGAGFGAAIGAPWAGMIFGMEVIRIGRLRLFAWFQCLIASFVGYAVTLLMRAPHTRYPIPEIPNVDVRLLLWVALAGVIFGLAARFFSVLTHAVEEAAKRWIGFPPLRPFVGGVILILLFYGEGSFRYVGLGIPFIQSALEQVAGFADPVWKTVFTALTIGTGFKGGEFIPLVYIGATLGSALSVVIPLGFSFLGALGFAAVFGGASNTPLACTIMAMEIFGYRIAPFAFIACYMSYSLSGHRGIYRAQRVHRRKGIP